MKRKISLLTILTLVGVVAYNLFKTGLVVFAMNYSDGQEIIFKDRVIPYANIGRTQGDAAQTYIDDHKERAATWAGTEVQHNNDGKSTHIIGHAENAFAAFQTAKEGESFYIRDVEGDLQEYKIVEQYTVDTHAIEKETGANLRGVVEATDVREQIVVQTCLDDTWRVLHVAIPA
jgi:hypothetical protein